MGLRRALDLVLVGVLLASAIAGLGTLGSPTPARAFRRPTRTHRRLQGIHKIRHVIVVMQENRSFDSYFGTYPGADGFPRDVCVPDRKSGGCDRPYHDRSDLNRGGPHSEANAIADVDGGKMNGFVAQAQDAQQGCVDLTNPWCRKHGRVDVMGYHDQREIPNYWTYARNFVLQDQMFAPNASWSLPVHLLAVSGWSAKCKVKGDPMSCVDAPDLPATPPDFKGNSKHTIPDYAWTDITYLLHKHHVSWRYYVFEGTEPDCRDDAAMSCKPIPQDAKTPGIWNPLPYFSTVRENWQLDNVTSLRNFFKSARTGKLPAVSWIIPTGSVSDHPPGLVSAGQAYVTTLINTIMRSPNWKSTAIFLFS